MCLEQGTRSLEEHLMDYLFLAPLTTFLDDVLCSFLIAGLNISTRAQLSGRGPRGSFQGFVEWVLASCGSLLTVRLVDDDASPTHDPVHNQNHPDGKDRQLEPTAGHVSDSAATFEPAPVEATEPNNVMEPEQHKSDQVCEPAATSIAKEFLVDIEGMEVSPTNPPATDSLSLPISHHHSKMTLRCGLFHVDICTTLQDPLQSPTSSATLASLSPISPSVPPLPPLSGVVTPLDCWESSPPVCGLCLLHSTSTRRPDSHTCAPSTLGVSSDHRTFGFAGLARYVGSASVRLRSTYGAEPTYRASPAKPKVRWSLLTPRVEGAQVWESGRRVEVEWSKQRPQTYGPFAALWPSTRSAAASSALPQAPPPPSVAPAQPQPSGSLLPPRGVIAAAPSRSSVSCRSIGSLATWWAPHPTSTSPPDIAMMSSSCLPPWLLPPGMPPWSSALVVHWGTIIPSLFKATLWITRPWTLMFCPLWVGRPPPEPPPSFTTIQSAGFCHPVTSPSLQPSATSSSPNTLPPSLGVSVFVTARGRA
ncbi:hypothetical protein DPX16_7076 [Anabarilius grahami]|uniref:Uncharacterized protein n=1 Tax=Anabarilius grahami TaxID=495550 RepID=A0A3N0Y1N3_ANAGA|nr:hypothetical protein DPX16_7076 [Anabarilius grahami]